jgi:hypothetical protein
MTKADLLILQDAAEEFSLESAENLGVNKSVCLQTAALAILCRVVSSLMAGEGEKALSMSNTEIVAAAERGELPIYTPSSGEFERGWNAALDAAIAEMRERGFMMDADPTVMMLRRLRKPAQEEGK